MFKLPVCPYCKTVYGYGEIRKNKNKKIIQCYHCKNNFKQNHFPGCAVSAVILIAAAVVWNLIILNMTADFITSIIPIILISVTAVIIFMILIPFFTSYKKIKGIEEKEIPDIKITGEDVRVKQKRSVKVRNKKSK
jgi:hypothetical protein